MKIPTWLYRGEESKIFDADCPEFSKLADEGWCESPQEAEQKEEAPKKRGRPKKEAE